MEAHPEVGLLGSYVTAFNDVDDTERLVKYQTEHEAIVFQLLFHTHFPHPAAVLRTSVLKDHNLLFEEEYEFAEDYGLWNRMADYCKLAILPEVLVKKRTHQEQYTELNLSKGAKATAKIRQELLQKVGVRPSQTTFDTYEEMLRGHIPTKRAPIIGLLDLLEELILKNRVSKKYHPQIFEPFFAERFWLICTQSTHLGSKIFSKFNQAKVFETYTISRKQKLIFYIKAMLKYRYANPKIYPVLEA